MSAELREWLATGQPILADGAMGTMLHSRGFGFDLCFDELNVLHPQEISAIHTRYIQAGARIIETNTFGANYYKLLEHGLEHRVEELNAAGVRIARSAAAESGTVFWSPEAWDRWASGWLHSDGSRSSRPRMPIASKLRP